MNFLKNKLNVIAAVLIAVFLVSVPASAQLTTRFGGEFNAIDYAYGYPSISFPALNVAAGNTATGASQTITLVTGSTVNSAGVSLNPITTTTPIIVGIGANAETVTPTAVSNCNLPSTQTPAPGQPACTITGTFNNLHGPQEPVISGSFGVQESVNLAKVSGGVVIVSPGYTQLGGTTAAITSATPSPNVYIRDNRGLGSPYYTMQPTTLTALATPATQTASTIVFTSATGTWAATASYFCVTYIDALGGESPCSATYTQTPTVNYTLTVTSPAASTGAVGWRMYAGITSVALAYLLPITSTSCTLTTLEVVVPACAIGSNGTWAAAYLSTTSLAPGAIGVTATNNPVPQGHTTFGYQPSGSPGFPFQTNFGPFGTTTIASATASAVTPLGSFVLPAGYQNIIGRTIRVSGKINLTAGASSTLGIFLGTTWAGGVTAGLPVTVCNPVSGFVWATAAAVANFSCTMTTNAVGATAIGSIQPESWFLGNTAAGTGTTSPSATEKSAAAIGSLGLFAQNQYTVYITPLVAADTTVQLMSLHIEVIQ